MEIKAKLHVKYDIEQVSPTFKKRRFVVAYAENPMYPQFVEFQMLQDRVSELDKYNTGDMIAVSFDIKGREWKSPSGEVKYFNSLDAWKVAPAEGAGAPAGGGGGVGGGGGAIPPPPPIDITQMGGDDDLPF